MRTRSTIACEKLEYCTVFFEVLWGSRSGRGHALLQRGEGTFFNVPHRMAQRQGGTIFAALWMAGITSVVKQRLADARGPCRRLTERSPFREFLHRQVGMLR